MSKEITFPVMDVKMVDSNKVQSNEYNPNKVAKTELDLLALSISEDGVTQPIVTYYDPETDIYVVVDGYHRYIILTKRYKCPQVPVVVIYKPLPERMASTVRHNRARGKHQVELMSQMVLSLINLGKSDSEIAKHLGMSAEEVLRLKQQTGIAGLFKGQSHSMAWVSDENDPSLK